ncbi:hypothetical protein BDN70DRAFT_909448 [Pholiota conissans]|uniref:Transposase n=1 Tax=Pholiota conissans TaxID=109636 RepID=A0A9P5YKU8_9AGAR|nr:hypothetical protein BDN70DRAFT_909448 [Pholiota conissans]
MLTSTFTARSQQEFYHLADALTVNQTLLRNGYIGATPERPSLAFSITLFEVFRQIHRVCPRLSIYGMTKALAHIHGHAYKNHYAEQFSSGYDCYLEILRNVECRCQAALKRDDPRWKQQNVCPPCLYRIEDEPTMKFSMLVSMDGNNSLKLVDSTFKAGTVRDDDRKLDSFRWISAEDVDIFKDEVKRPHGPPFSTASPPIPKPGIDGVSPSIESDEDIAWLNTLENGGDLKEKVNVCVERWKSAGPEARKKMFALFAIAGIFVVICRHGHVLLVCDMIRSGELMKYPIALTNALLNRYGKDIGLGYDIMCAFMKTLDNSTLKGRVGEMNLQGIVPAFHGHAHNRLCQVHWHPLYKEGVGLEDLEVCERTFHKSNELASGTRLATPFHRMQEIEEHWNFIDIDKHAASANFIYQNYRQALEKIQNDGEVLASLSVRLNTTNADYEHYLDEERQYLKALQVEPENAAKLDFQMLDHNIIYNNYTARKIRDVRTRYTTSFSRWEACNTLVCEFEEAHGIEERWTPTMQVYKDAQVLMTERKYRRALDELERLVVQRLFEMTKLGMNGIGYRLRDKIGRSLKTRSDAIATALNNYNEAASLLSPPRPTLTWTSVVQAANLADFDLLRDSRTDILSKPWAEGPRREAMNLYFGIKRAHEEIGRLNVEIKRLLTFMLDDHVDFYHAVGETVMTNPILAAEISSEYERRSVIHTQISLRLRKTSELPGFSGSLDFGRRVGRQILADDEWVDDNEVLEEDLGLMEQFVDTLSS